MCQFFNVMNSNYLVRCMKSNVIFILFIISLFISGCISLPFKQEQPVAVSEFYIPQNKEFWENHVFPNNNNPEIVVKNDGITYTINICTNFIIYHVKTTDPDFVTQEGISPGMSFARVKEILKYPRWNYEPTSYDFIFSTNEESSIIFYLSLRDDYRAWFRGEYDSEVKAPDDNDQIVYINYGISHGIIEDGAVLLPPSYLTNYFATKAAQKEDEEDQQ